MQWWIETAGKLGPALIAFLLLVTTRAQNRSINAVSLRAAQVEDQKLRLSLLERRLEAIDAMREAVAHYQATGEPNREARGKLIDALRLVEVVFAEEHAKSISETIRIGWRMSAITRRLENPKSDEERAKLIDEIVELDGSFGDKSLKLVDTLIVATRMQDVPPLQMPRSIIGNGFARVAASVRRFRSR